MKKSYFDNLIKPILIAEISGNHQGSLKKAKKLISTAKVYGASLVKIQSYSPDTITIKSKRNEFKIKKGLWKNKYLWDLYNEAQTPFKWHKDLFKYANKIGIKCFSSPFDETAVDLLEKLNCPFYKLASFELTHIPLIKKIAKTKKPIIISTGMANLNEISKAFYTAKKYGSSKIILLYCVSNYPSKNKDFNLNNIKILRDKFRCEVGLSDHSNDNIIAQTAVAMGVKIIEKHIALNNQTKGVDIDFSLKGREIRKFLDDLYKVNKIMGKEIFFRSNDERKNVKFRRSIYLIKDIKAGEKITKNHLKIIRPHNGLMPEYHDKILGKKMINSLKGGTPLKLKNIKSF